MAGLGAVLVVNGRLDGLWLALVGWFLAGTAASERAHGVMNTRLAGLAAVPADARSATAVRDVARLLPPDGVLAIVTPADEILRRSIGPAGLVIVRPDGRVVRVGDRDR